VAHEHGVEQQEAEKPPDERADEAVLTEDNPQDLDESEASQRRDQAFGEILRRKSASPAWDLVRRIGREPRRRLDVDLIGIREIEKIAAPRRVRADARIGAGSSHQTETYTDRRTTRRAKKLTMNVRMKSASPAATSPLRSKEFASPK